MFIRLSNVPTMQGDRPKSSWVNSDHIIEMFVGETRQLAEDKTGARTVQPAIPCTYISLSGDKDLKVLEVPDQIMGLLNGPQIQGAPL